MSIRISNLLANRFQRRAKARNSDLADTLIRYETFSAVDGRSGGGGLYE